MKINLFLTICLLLMIGVGTCCKQHRNSELYEFINRISPDATDSGILYAIDSAIIIYRLAPHEVESLCKSYYVDCDKLKNYK